MRVKQAKGRVASLMLAILAGSLVVAAQAEQNDADDAGAAAKPAALRAREAKNGFGKLETLTGAILTVRPEQETITLARRGPTESPSTVLVGNSSEVTAMKGLGETDYSFKVTGSTLVRVDGQRASLAELSELQDRQATVRFIPKRTGNFALSVEVSR